MNQNALKQNSRKKIGLALSGGFIRSTASIGVIEVLEENNIPIDMISGCSAGAGVAAAYSAGSLTLVRDRLKNSLRRDYWKIVFEPTIPTRGILKGERTREFFKEFVGEKTFNDLDRPTFIAATDLRSLSPVIIHEGPVYEAIQASVGVAGLFVPIKYENKILTDGGNFHMIPSQPLYENGADYVIAVDSSQPPNLIIKALALFYKRKKQYSLNQQAENLSLKILNKDPHIIDLMGRAVKLSSARIDNFHHSAYPYNILIRPHVHEYKRWSVSKVNEIIEHGRKAAEKMIPQIKKDLEL